MYDKSSELMDRIESLERNFERNRNEMHALAEQNRRLHRRYGELLEANREINEQIRNTLAQLWTLEERK